MPWNVMAPQSHLCFSSAGRWVISGEKVVIESPGDLRGMLIGNSETRDDDRASAASRESPTGSEDCLPSHDGFSAASARRTENEPDPAQIHSDGF